MNGELLSVLDYLEREKGIDKQTLLDAVESSLESAARKSSEPLAQTKNISVQIDRETGSIRAFAQLTVLKNKATVTPDDITLVNAKKTHPKAKIGDVIEVEVTTKNFGRIAAQTAKQAIIQKIREAEKDLIFAEFKDRVDDITMGTVRRIERGNIVVDLGRTEAILPQKEQCPGENYRIGDRIRAFVVDVRQGARGAEILLSRTHVGLVRRLFELEVPEIADGTVQIKGIVREAGFRTKIAVHSDDPKIDPIGACVGMRGSRVKNIVRELENEKLDIVKWEPELKAYITNALNPANLSEIVINKEAKNVKVYVHDDQLSIAIGKRGQNVRLASKLVQWPIDIRKIGETDEKLAEMASAVKEKDPTEEKPENEVEAAIVEDPPRRALPQDEEKEQKETEEKPENKVGAALAPAQEEKKEKKKRKKKEKTKDQE